MKKVKRGVGFIAQVVLACFLALTLSSCGILGPLGLSAGSVAPQAGSTWAIYWYMCGSNLETDWGCASRDLEEMMAASLPENVEIIIQTGGSNSWQNTIDPNARQIMRYSDRGMEQLENWSMANMGDPATLIEFLNYCNFNYPAEHRMLLFWDHGGGSLGGVCNDEQFGMDSLSLSDLEFALASTSQTVDGSPLYEIVGFDACLMATIDTAAVFSDYARYMVASQEIEPGSGWEYTGMLEALAENPHVGGDVFGRAICDSYLESLRKPDINMATLSLVDLDRCRQLFEAYDRLGDEVLVYASMNQNYLGAYSRLALETENFYNSPSTGYTNMMDLGDLVYRGQQQGLFPLYGDAVLNALNDCVVYKVTGQGHQSAWGLSCFYNYAGGTSTTQKFMAFSRNMGYNYFNEYMYSGELSSAGTEYVRQASANLTGQTVTPARIDSTSLESLEGYPLVLGPNGQWQLDVGSELAEQIAAVYTTQAWVSGNTEDSFLALYGMNANFPKDFENGIFTTNFQNDWAAIGELPNAENNWGRQNEYMIYMEPMSTDEENDTYTSPVMINDERYSLIIVQDRQTGSFELLGAMLPIDDETSMAGKELYQLQDGDVIEPIVYILLAEGNIDSITGSRLFDMPLGRFTYDSTMEVFNRPVSFASEEFPDLVSHFMVKFVIVDYAGNRYYSGSGFYSVLNEVATPYDDPQSPW